MLTHTVALEVVLKAVRPVLGAINVRCFSLLKTCEDIG